ncbi:MAG: radical SAM protein [Desulfobacterales bacterium]|nr:radical SAM protein [Desulfobacterales bacterium]
MKFINKKEARLADFPCLIYQNDNTVYSGRQCDCACARPLFTEQHPISFTEGFYVLNNPIVSVPLSAGYHAVIGENFRITALNTLALDIAEHFSQARSPDDVPYIWKDMWGEKKLHEILIKMIEVGILLPETHAKSQINNHLPILTAWLHTTNNCNLRCTYCYIPRINSEMTIETGKAAIEATFRSALKHEYQEILLKYAGGEPLLRFNLIAELHRYAKSLARHHNIKLDGIILSNGTILTQKTVEQMLPLGLRLMISLDGLNNFHDCQRPCADGSGSFEAVSKAIDMAISNSLIPDISVTVTNGNIGGLHELVSWILDRDLPFSLNFYRENDLSLPENDLKMEEEKITKGLLRAYKVIESNLPKKDLLASLADHANFSAPHLKTCSVGQGYLVFNHQGRVAKCQMAINDPVTDLCDSDPLSIIRKSCQGIQNISVEEKNDCRTCKWRYWCAGGCPLLTYRRTDRYDTKSPNCNIYKAIYPEVVRLEGLRLLHNF